jgi:hypothetical protein
MAHSCSGVPQQSQQMEDKHIQAVEVLSNYVMFLLVVKPEMLPIYRLQKAHTDVCHAFDDIWSSHRHGNDACNSSAPSHKSWNPFNVLKEQFRSLNELFHKDGPNASRIEQRKELISYMFNPGCKEWVCVASNLLLYYFIQFDGIDDHAPVYIQLIDLQHI